MYFKVDIVLEAALMVFNQEKKLEEYHTMKLEVIQLEVCCSLCTCDDKINCTNIELSLQIFADPYHYH